jgi:hypothetical protein
MKNMKNVIVVPIVLMALLFSSCHQNQTKTKQPAQSEMQERKITAQMALEAVTNYCHREYDWSVAKDNPDMMSVTMGDETDTEYQVIFRSYTGALVYFHVDKASGTARMVESVPALGIDSVAGTIDLLDYLKQTPD